MAFIFYSSIINTSKIVIISIFCKIKAIASSTFNSIICIFTYVEKAGMLIYAMTNTVFTKIIPINRLVMTVAQLNIPKAFITIAFLIEEIKISFNRVPSALNKSRTIIISFSVIAHHPYATKKSALVKLISYIGIKPLCFSVQALISVLVKIIVAILAVFICKFPPA